MKLKSLTTALAVLPLLGAVAFAGPVAHMSKSIIEEELVVVPRTEIVIESAYTFGSEFKRDSSFGEQDSLENRASVAYRFPLGAEGWFLRVGAKYGRFDFGSTSAPVPNKFQSAAGSLALEYRVQGRLGMLLETSPGVYFSNDINEGAFDAPTVFALAYPVFGGDRFFLVVGAAGSILREYPILPIVGAVWQISERVELNLLLPDPRLIYRPNENIELWAGGSLTGGSYRSDNTDTRGERYRNAVVDYSEYRAGVGVVFKAFNTFKVDIGGGYTIQRSFNYHRLDDRYRLDPAPYARVAIVAAF